MSDVQASYKKYAIIVTAMAAVFFTVIMLISPVLNVYKPVEVISAVPDQFKTLNIVFIVLSVLSVGATFLLKMMLVKKVKDPGFEGDKVQTLTTQGLLILAPAIIPLAAGFTMVLGFHINFRVVQYYFLGFILAFYLGYMDSRIWKDILIKDDLK